MPVQDGSMVGTWYPVGAPGDPAPSFGWQVLNDTKTDWWESLQDYILSEKPDAGIPLFDELVGRDYFRHDGCAIGNLCTFKFEPCNTPLAGQGGHIAHFMLRRLSGDANPKFRVSIFQGNPSLGGTEVAWMQTGASVDFVPGSVANESYGLWSWNASGVTDWTDLWIRFYQFDWYTTGSTTDIMIAFIAHWFPGSTTDIDQARPTQDGANIGFTNIVGGGK